MNVPLLPLENAAELGDVPLLPLESAAELGGLTQAFESFAAATARLEREYAALQARVAGLAAEVEEKNRLLIASLERERRLEAEALRASRLAAMGETAAMLAHEVRNPLGAMELFTGLLLQDLRDRPEAQRLARQVARGIVDLNHLVTNLLEFTRTRTPTRAPVYCAGLIDEVLHYVADLCQAHRVVTTHERADGVHALADPHLLRPVILNLLRNAVQAMPDGGKLLIRTRRRGHTVAIAVVDTGPGIAREHHEDIFRPFFSTRARGTGLGLAVARGLVEAMKGRLELKSEAGRGATFTVVLPAFEEDVST